MTPRTPVANLLAFAVLLIPILFLGARRPAGAQSLEFGYTGKSTSDSLAIFDLATGTLVPPDLDLLPEGNYPYDATIHPRGTELWVCGASGDGVVVIDTSNNTEITRFSVVGSAEYSVDVLFGREGELAYVSGRDSDAVAIVDVDTHTVLRAIPIGSTFFGPGKMALNVPRNLIYAVDWYGDEIYEIDPVTESVTPVALGSNLWDVAVHPGGDLLYVLDRGPSQMHVVDADDLSVITSVLVGTDPWGIDITPDGDRVVVASEDSGTVSVIDTTTLGVDTVNLPPGSDPRDVDLSEDGLLAYVPSGDLTGDDAVYVIDLGTATLVDTIDVGPGNPNVVAVAPQLGAIVFRDDFESGDTSAWSGSAP